MAFNEQAYLAANPDVAASVASGAFSSGADHYAQYGVNEGRAGDGAYGGTAAGSPNWASGAGYATNISAPAGSPAYYAQYQDAYGAYKAGVGRNPITGNFLDQEKDTWWGAYGNYMLANPDVAMNYMVNGMAGKGVTPEQYALSHFDMSASQDGSLRDGMLPTGQIGIERIFGKQGGTVYNVFGGANSQYGRSDLDPAHGLTISQNGADRYKQVFGSNMSNLGPFYGKSYSEDRRSMRGGLESAFNGLGAGGAFGAARQYAPAPYSGGGDIGGTRPSSGGGSSSSFGGAPSLGFNLSNITGPSQWDVNGNQTVANQLTALMASDNPMLQQARARAMQQSNARGLSNSSIAQTAGDAAAYDEMMKIALQDAATNATAGQSNTAAKNQFNSDYNAFLRNGYMADFNLSANEWAAQQDFARQQQLARLQAELNASSGATQTNNNLQQGYINALNESRKNWAIQYKELMADPNMSPENKTSALTSLAASYNTQIKQYAGLLGWDFDKWDIEYTADAPAANKPVDTTKTSNY